MIFDGFRLLGYVLVLYVIYSWICLPEALLSRLLFGFNLPKGFQVS